MASPVPSTPVRLAACDCLTPFGDAAATHAALLRGERALRPVPVRGASGGDLVPLALLGNRPLDESAPPLWLPALRTLLAPLAGRGWGSARRPVYVTSSNFGVGNLHAFKLTADPAHLPFATPVRSVGRLREAFGWGPSVTLLSHACVSAHLGLVQASRVLSAGLADAALVFSFDFLSPFVTGGFHALKILNARFPSPYREGETGSIGLGDGAGYAVLTRDTGDFVITAQSLHNELHHFTANQPDGAGFDTCLAPLRAAAAGRRLWLKGHGTGTLEAGRLEVNALTHAFPGSPLAGWKGGLGHTLGSCGLVELAIVCAAVREGRTPGTVGGGSPALHADVALAAFDNQAFDGVLCTSNAFGGAHAALLLTNHA